MKPTIALLGLSIVVMACIIADYLAILKGTMEDILRNHDDRRGTSLSSGYTNNDMNEESSEEGHDDTHSGLDSGYTNPNVLERIAFFRKMAFQQTVVTDKVRTHRYHHMYGTFLLPYYAVHPSMKMLEIGLGCTVRWGPGASVALWKNLFPQAELWEAEYNGECVKDQTEKGRLDGINVLVGDQADPQVLDSWIHNSGGSFDVVIDDGGHTNCQIKNSFDKLWPHIKDGGLYFIEDLMVGYDEKYRHDAAKCSSVIMSHVLADWTEQLLELTLRKTQRKFTAQNLYQAKYALPEKLSFIHCQLQSCVLGKGLQETGESEEELEWYPPA